VDLTGAAAGSGGDGTPGYGARVQSSLPVTPGTVLHVIVGCQGTNCPATLLPGPTYLPGGYNGGGAGYGYPNNVGGTGGGGASDIRLGGMDLHHRVVVAGGGGGYMCSAYCGNQKGGDSGRFGAAGSVVLGPCNGVGRPPAGGGNWTSGGMTGPFLDNPRATSGSLGFGGNGGAYDAGGGGGGYYGGTIVLSLFRLFNRKRNFLNCFCFLLGGGGIHGGGAGGGSSYSIDINAIYTSGYSNGDGAVLLEFFVNPTFKFSCTKSVQDLTVPLGYHYMHVDMTGAASGSGGVGTPGYGARVQSYLSVTPGVVLHITVGGRGNNCSQLPIAGYLPGGYNGGGDSYGQGVSDVGGTGGGGASDIRLGGSLLSHRVVVAGGGGGYYCGTFCAARKGGDGGKIGLQGSNTVSSCSAPGHETGGTGGSWTSGGIGGYSSDSPSSTTGSLGYGGAGGSYQSGGGGGGFYGGKWRCFFLFFCSVSFTD
jgi:hypothetical protein